ncbi:glycosyltransferase family 4 protein [Bifidobacterium stellenboschense]|uniref:Glycosyltransferase n=1 Tax=Bifidobacterium stellenboschense TaxID=762211 RepID=A0A087DR90_9BIFI|nr:glycosyltransferase family 1 protein [Bifidobacterium stellenboschense]KFI98040.1 glycosyltransferase [Bifidobacterium stellenboschense]
MNTIASRPLRVLVVSESSLEQTNGVSGSIRHILDRFAERGFDARVIAPGPAPEGGAYAGYPVEEVPSFPIQRFNVAVTTKSSVIRDILDGPKPDIIHVAAPISKLGHAALIAGDRLHVPTVAIYQTDVAQYARRFAREAVTGERGTTGATSGATGADAVDGSAPQRDGAWPRHTKWLRRIGKAAGEQAERIVADRIARMHNLATMTLAPTEDARNRLESFGVDPSLIRLWGRGVDSALFSPARADDPQSRAWHREWSDDGKLPVVGYVGRLAPEKQVERLAALAGLPMRLVVVGGGVSEQDLRERLPHAVFTGMLHGRDLADAYAALDVFVHTGAEETFGQTIQEAMASGLPVVAPASGGPLDLVDEGVTGLLFDPHDEDDADLRDHVARLIGDESLRRRMGAAGLAAVRGRTWPAMVDRLIDYYRLAMELRMAQDG